MPGAVPLVGPQHVFADQLTSYRSGNPAVSFIETARGHYQVEDRVLDAGARQEPRRKVLWPALVRPVNDHPVDGTLLRRPPAMRNGDVDLRAWLVEHAVYLGGGLMAKHRARSGPANRGPQAALALKLPVNVA